MSGRLFDKYGAIYQEDIIVLEDALMACALTKTKVKVLEIGTHAGATARGMKRYLSSLGRGCDIDYWGIDPGLLCTTGAPWKGANFVNGKSEESFHLVPNDFDLIFVDGNHARNSVILDTLNYKDKVVLGGFMVFHDAGPGMQGQDYQYHGPKIPEFHVAVLDAFKLMRWPFPGWMQRMYEWPKDHNRCGSISFQRMK